MDVIPTSIPDVKVLRPKKHGDHRGFFSEVYSRKAMADVGIADEFVQDNHSMSAARGVLRGLHYQVGSAAQAKLVRVTKGAILDIAVDIRRNSPTFGWHVAAELSAENWLQIYVPVGFAHGFVTLQENTEVIYKVTTLYSPKDERGIRWNDPALQINWGIDESQAVLSDRDRKHPMLAEQADLF
jgi:dTDP-4-dehydrorhamnose 3,5-epimerase